MTRLEMQANGPPSLIIVVLDGHAEGADGPAAVPGAAVGVLLGGVHLLPHRVLELVLVLGLAAEERLHDLHLLLDDDLVHLRQVLQPRRAVVGPELDLKQQGDDNSLSSFMSGKTGRIPLKTE